MTPLLEADETLQNLACVHLAGTAGCMKCSLTLCQILYNVMNNVQRHTVALGGCQQGGSDPLW